MKMMDMGWQPTGNDAQEDTDEEKLPVAKRWWLDRDVKRATQLIIHSVSVASSRHGSSGLPQAQGALKR